MPTRIGNGQWYSQSVRETARQFKTKNATATHPASALISIYPKEIKVYSEKKLYVGVHSSRIHKSQKLAITEMYSVGKQLKHTVVQPHHGTAVSRSKEQTSDTPNNMDES